MHIFSNKKIEVEFQFCRAPEDSGPVNFVRQLGDNAVNVIPTEERQSVLGCLRGCTRELRVSWAGLGYILYSSFISIIVLLMPKQDMARVHKPQFLWPS